LKFYKSGTSTFWLMQTAPWFHYFNLSRGAFS
jgi:hypothetical protein